MKALVALLLAAGVVAGCAAKPLVTAPVPAEATPPPPAPPAPATTGDVEGRPPTIEEARPPVSPPAPLPVPTDGLPQSPPAPPSTQAEPVRPGAPDGARAPAVPSAPAPAPRAPAGPPSRSADTASPGVGRATPQPAGPTAPGRVPEPSRPVLSARLGDEDRIAQDVETRLTHTMRTVDSIKRDQLVGDQKEILSSILDFVAKAREALSAKDLQRARALAEKAATLAEELAGIRKPPAKQGPPASR